MLLMHQSHYGPYVLRAHHRSVQPDQLPHVPRPFYGIWCVLGGRVRLTERGVARSIDSPVAFLLPPGPAVRLQIPPACRTMSVEFDAIATGPCPRLWDKHWQHHPARWRRQPAPHAIWGIQLPVRIPDLLWGGCLATVESCSEEYWHDDLGRMRANARLGQWLASLVQHIRGRTDADPSADWLVRCEQFAITHLQNGLTVAQWSRRMGMGRHAFTRRFKQVKGMTPAARLIELRYAEIMRLLNDPQVPLKQIARLTGFADTVALSHFFKRHGRLSPGAYRKRLFD